MNFITYFTLIFMLFTTNVVWGKDAEFAKKNKKIEKINKKEAGKIRFHPPETEAEKALDGVLNYNDSNCLTIYNNLIETDVKMSIENIKTKEINYENRKQLIEITPSEKKLKYCQKYFTDRIMKKSSQDQREICNNSEYGPEAYCWISVNPILCSQDIDDIGYIYYTITETKTEAWIYYHWISLIDQDYKLIDKHSSEVLAIKTQYKKDYLDNHNKNQTYYTREMKKIYHKALKNGFYEIPSTNWYAKMVKDNNIWKLDNTSCLNH